MCKPKELLCARNRAQNSLSKISYEAATRSANRSVPSIPSMLDMVGGRYKNATWRYGASGVRCDGIST